MHPMRNETTFLLSVAALLAAPVASAPAQQASAGRVVTVRAENPAAIERRDETISVPWAALRQQLPALAAGRVRVREGAGGSGPELVTQLYDADADGQPDSLLFQASFWPGEAKSFVVDAAAAGVKAEPRVHVKFVPERTDVAWESDRIAFRTYGQLLWKLENLHSSGYDVWVKRTRALVLDRWYAAGHDSYHLDKGEGADFFKVGPTLGAGGTAVWRDGKLHRAENFAKHRVLADGPIRATFELDFDPWDAGGLRVTETKRISIDAGANLFRQESVYRVEGGAAAAAPQELTYAVGFVKRAGLVGSTSRAHPWAWLSTWGPMDNKPGEGGHGDLGSGVLLDRARLVDVKELDDHYVLVATARPGQPVVQYVGAGWTGSRDFSGVEDWWRYLDTHARRLAAPVKITVGPSAASTASSR
jgi:pectinesterase